MPRPKKQRTIKQRATKRPNRAARRAHAASLLDTPTPPPLPKAGSGRPGTKPKRGISPVVAPGGEPGPIVGVVVRQGKFLELEPLFQPGQSLLLAREGVRPRPGDLVLYTYSHGRRGRVLEIIGQKGVLSDVLEALLRERLAQRGFDSDVLAEAAEVSVLEQRVDPQRKDLRQLFTFTVDPEDARDFDDALSFQASATGVTVFVHIADVSYYVAEGGVIDTEALRRTTSVYVPGAVEPMLPPLLSNGVCSLQPQVDRKAVTVELAVDEQGQVQKAHFYRSLIRSDRRLDYEELEEIFRGEREADLDLAEALELGRPLAQTLRAGRMARGNLRITSSEPEFHWNEAGMVADAHPVEELESHHFIEDFMILANEQVATYLERERVPTLYRVHEPPDPFLLDHLLDVLSSLDLPTPPFDPMTATPQDVRRTVNEVAESIEQVTLQGRGKPALEQQLLRSQSRAVYQTHNVGHFGLASPTYCHFTSPIRRYPDLLVHRGLLARLGQAAEPNTSTLSEWAEHCSTKEREASKVELKADDIALAHLLKQRLDDEGWNTAFSGLVLSLIRSGAFVRFEGLYEGFLPARLLPNDYYELNELESALVGRRTGVAFRLADFVQVRVSGIDEARGRIDVALYSPGTMKTIGTKLIAQNKKAFHDYHIEESIEAGIVLTGTEVKSARQGRVNLREAYAAVENNELWLIGAHISPYEQGNVNNHEPLRRRKLLIHGAELRRLVGKVQRTGFTLVPTKMYFKDGRAKVEVALAKGKALYDKREALAKKDAARDVERALKSRFRA